MASPPVGVPIPAPTPKSVDATKRACRSSDAKNIVVCAQRKQGYRLDPGVMDATRQVETNSRSATSAVPAAQAMCSAQPTGCGTSLDSLDLANVAVVVGMMGVRAAKGEDWTKAFKTGGPDEYQLYRQAKQRREAQDAERAAARVRMKAEEAGRAAEAANASSK